MLCLFMALEYFIGVMYAIVDMYVIGNSGALCGTVSGSVFQMSDGRFSKARGRTVIHYPPCSTPFLRREKEQRR